MSSVGSATSGAIPAFIGTSPSQTQNPGNVSDVLSQASGLNGLIAGYNNGDWAGIAAKFGTAIALRDQRGLYGGIINAERDVLNNAGRLGVPIELPPAPATFQANTPLTPITVAAFSFQSGGSTYAVTPSADGSLIGTKDGKAWNTWQLSGPGSSSDASIARAILTTDSAANGPHRQTSLIEVTI
jgi:hypothetical protein